ncbi:hypothetical protein BMS3Abin07_00654 [bacterium BMS3Abin07]|nr:hypothetical protein BMS3Abin07_00654 [bacterium BMS3Abin07]GBE32891.1 hypothetical protein BMS3Bbin05_01819 [bacterium BMS3Bbin05]HDO21483.1 YkgJ family cysteine cluster protein [Nitrospirota bacterium]HDZ88402.1 YkgJ family cysteine cluster protein [Nitrospirota bacterium]
MDIDISPYLNRLAGVYKEIDNEYERVAGLYDNFSCEGCENNCCDTVLYHHTLIENLFLIEGFGEIDDDRKKEIISRAKDYVKELSKRPFDMTGLSIMCPMNFNGLCSIYEYRPLICRIHGLPAMLKSPQGGVQHWKGCLRFQDMHGQNISHEIDRTPFYTKIAFIEGDLRKEMVFMPNHKKTIADMVIDQTKDEIPLIKRLNPSDFR